MTLLSDVLASTYSVHTRTDNYAAKSVPITSVHISIDTPVCTDRPLYDLTSFNPLSKIGYSGILIAALFIGI